MLAREYCDATKRRFKPVILSHRMMPGLLEVGQAHPPSSVLFDMHPPQCWIPPLPPLLLLLLPRLLPDL
jgi:hypothetical protein